MAGTIKKVFIKGTLILTIASLITKMLGFYNRIFLSTTIGAKELGIYQLIFPVYLIVHSLCCQGFEMGIMKFVSEEAAKGHKRNVWRYWKCCFWISLTLSIILMIIVMLFHKPIAVHILKQQACSKSLFILAFAFPILSIKDSILAYYYALKHTELPAGCQLLEQVVRVGSIWYIACFVLWYEKDASLATIGLVLGESVSLLLCLLYLPKMKKEINQMQPVGHTTITQVNTLLSRRTVINNLMQYCIPVTTNRLLLTVLSSIEAILVPYILTKTYHDENLALSLYGILTGMALTFVLFPSAITNSVAMMLLPTVSEAQAQKNTLRIRKAASSSMHYCFLLGILCTSIFIVYGKDLGTVIFHEQAAGEYLSILAWLCPFIYIGTTFTSILNGLGKTTLTFFNNVIAVFIRILSIIVLVPKIGIQGYLFGLLVSYGLLALLCVLFVKNICQIYFHPVKSILSPICLCFMGITFSLMTKFMFTCQGYSLSIWSLGTEISILTGIYMLGMWLLRL